MFGSSPVSRIVQGVGVAAMLLACGARAQQPGKQPTVVATGNWPAGISAVDVNGDGRVDLVVTAHGATQAVSETRILLQQSDGSFSAGAAIATAGASVIASNIVDGTTVPDLLWVSVSGTTADIYKAASHGDGTFYPGILVGSFPVRGNLTPVFKLAVTNYRQKYWRTILMEDVANLELYQGIENPDGTMVIDPLQGQPGWSLPAGSSQMLVADLNGDGISDVVIQNSAGVQVYLGLDAGLKAPVTYACTGVVNSIALHDMDGDGHLDLVAEGLNGRIDIYHGNADGTFATASEVGSGAENGVTGSGGHLVAIADLNTDGNPDIITSTPTGISVLLGQGNLSYRAGLSYNAGPGRSSYALADLNGDGVLDLAVDSPEGVAILYGNPQGGFNTGLTFNTGQPAYSLALGDFSGRGVLDAAVATGTPQVQLMNGDGTGNFFAQNGPSPAGAVETNAGRSVWSHVVAGDFDGDGKQDVGMSLDGPVEKDIGVCIVCQPSDNGMSVMFGDGAGNFGTPVAEGPPETGTHYGMLASVDVNGDSISDLVNNDDLFAAGYDGAAGYRLGLPLINLFGYWSDGYLRPYQLIATGYLKAGRTSAPDVVVESLGNTLSFSAQKNDGTGTYSAGQQTFAMPTGIAVMTPRSSVLPATGLYPSALAIADIDGDGNGDFLVLYHNLASDPANPSATAQNLLYIFWGNGDGSFQPTPEIVTLSRNYYQLTVADVDGDGKQDLVMSDGYLVAVLFGTGLRSGFGHEAHYLAGMGINAVAVADVNGDGALDFVVANGGAVLSAGVVNNGVLAANSEVNTGGLTVLFDQAVPVAQVVNGTLVASPEPSVYARDITLTATLAPAAGAAAPTGTITFSIDGTQVGTAVTLANGVASYTIAGTAIGADLTNPIYWVGAHTLSAAYSGDANNAAATLHGTHTVIGQPTVSSITDLDMNLFYGQEIGYDNGIDARLDAEAVDPLDDFGSLNGGVLTTYIDGGVVCTISYGVGGRCEDGPFENFPVGTHTTYVSYSGNDYYAPSTSPFYNVVIVADPTATTVTSSLNPSTFGQAVTFTAVIADQYHVAEGTVNFLDGTTVIGTGTVDGAGTATFTTSTLAIGNHPINVIYVPNSANFIGSAAALPLPMGQEVDAVPPPPPPPPPPPGSFTLTVNPTALSIGVGNSVMVQVTVTALNGYSQPVQLACSGLPNETTCTFAQGLIGAGGGTTALIVSPAAPHSCGSSTPDFIAPNLRIGLAGLGLGVLSLLGLRRRKRLFRGLALALVATFALIALPLINGCSDGCKDFGTEPGSYTFTVSATSTGTPVTALTQKMTMKAHL